MNRLFLIDGHALIFRMYYAFLRRPMINSKGEDTSILFGFTKYILELARREQPTHLAVAFDPPCKTFRHEMNPAYKANRAETPELVKAALQPLLGILEALDIPVLMVPGYEADDVIGSMARRWEAAGFEVYMVSPDKDLGQLVSDRVFQYKPAKGRNEEEVVDKAALCARYGISDPAQIIDILTLWGDASDNVRGVRGIGEVGARKLVARYGSVDGILEAIEELTPRQQEAFREAEAWIRESRDLVTIRTDVPVGITEEALRLRLTATPESRRLFRQYEFASLNPLLPGTPDTAETPAPPQKGLPVPGRPADVTEEIRRQGAAALSLRNGWWCIASRSRWFRTADFGTVRPVLEDPAVVLVGYGLKEIWKAAARSGCEPAGRLEDLEIRHYLLNPESGHAYGVLCLSLLGTDPERLPRPETQAAGDAGTPPVPEAEPDLFSILEKPAGPTAATPADDPEEAYRQWKETALLLPLYDALRKLTEREPDLDRLYRELEMPLIPVLARMESAGFRIDCERLAAYRRQLQDEADRTEERIREMTGEPQLNVASPKQLGPVLFEKLALDPKAKKTKSGGYATDEETLTELQDRHPVIGEILRYRELKKLIGTYIDPLPALIDPADGKIHTTFNQALTATGRLSSVRPNLQNIPVRSESGKEIRRAFIPSGPDRLIVSADYSQIELRLMAELSGDPALLEAFREGKDIHTDTAARIFHEAPEAVTREQRSRAKTANFGIIYGISAFGLSQRLGISRAESRELIDSYFKSYPQVREYMERTQELARTQGFVTTLYGRKRYLPGITSRNPTVRGLAERNAVNAPIQGTAADLIKRAMIRVDARLRREGLQSRMILQVHDELVLDTLREEADTVCRLVREEMEGAATMSIPLTADCSSGENWLEAH